MKLDHCAIQLAMESKDWKGLVRLLSQHFNQPFENIKSINATKTLGPAGIFIVLSNRGYGWRPCVSTGDYYSWPMFIGQDSVNIFYP